MSDEVKYTFDLEKGEYIEVKVRSPDYGRHPETDIPFERETYINGDAPGRFKLVRERSEYASKEEATDAE